MSSLFHYTKLKTGIEKILPSFTLKANEFYATNDPRETFLWSFGGVNISDNTFDDDPIESSFRIGYEARKHAKVVCFTNEESGATNEMMWSHYGNSHEGICLEIDKEAFIKENQAILENNLHFFENVKYLAKENYKDKPSFYNSNNNWDNSLRNFIQVNYEYLFFTKSHFWEKEDEHRVVVIDEKWNGLFSIQKSLKAIIIGMYCYEKYLATIEEIINNKDIGIKQCVFQINTPRIEVENRPIGDYREHILKKYLKKFKY